MNPFDSYRLLITPLSPVHIGTGESYEPTNYVIEDGVLHEFDTGAAMQALTERDRAELLAIGNRRPDTGMIEALQKFFHDRRAPLMGRAVQRIPVLPGVANLYAKRVGQTANREADGKKVVNRLEIDRTSFNPITRLPLLFGSSLKGAIRTALLDKVNAGAGLLKVEDRRKGKWRNENNQEMQQRLFQYRAGKFELDPMRLIQLADAAWQGEPGLPAAQICLAVNRKKIEVKDRSGQVRKSQAESKELYQILECVSGWHYRAFAGQLTVQSVAELDHSHRDKLPVSDRRFGMKQISQACNTFYRPILEAEMQQMRDRRYHNSTWDTAIQSLLRSNAERFQRGEIFLLRVGRHSGAESVTLNGVRDIKIMRGKDEKPEYLDSAKTLWLAAEDKDQMQNLLPFGWLLVEVHPIVDELREWPELKATCEPYLVAAHAFAAKLKDKQAEIEQARQDAETKLRVETEKARLQAETVAREALAEAQRQARLAAMSNNQRRVEEFKEAFATRAKQLLGKFDRQNTDYHDRARKLARDALEGADWTPDEKRAAADAIAEWLPKVVERIDKDQLKKLKLSALRGQA